MLHAIADALQDQAHRLAGDRGEALDPQDRMARDHPLQPVDERVRVVERRQADVEARELVVLVVAAVVVVRGPRIEIALCRRSEADQHLGRQRGMARAHHADAGAQLLAHPRLDLRPVAIGQKVRLVDHHQVGRRQLLLEQLLERGLVVERLIGQALRRQRVRIGREQAIAHRRGIDHRDHAVDRDPGADLRPVERLDQGLGQGEARGLDHDVVRRRRTGQQPLHGRHEVVGHGAADAAVRQLDDVVLGAGRIAAAEQQLAVDADVAELVDDQRDPPAIVLPQQIADQAGLAGAQKTREHGGRDFRMHRRAPGYLRRCGRPAAIKTTASACRAIP